MDDSEKMIDAAYATEFAAREMVNRAMADNEWREVQAIALHERRGLDAISAAGRLHRIASQ